jgi:hypothetical protein
MQATVVVENNERTSKANEKQYHSNEAVECTVSLPGKKKINGTTRILAFLHSLSFSLLRLFLFFSLVNFLSPSAGCQIDIHAESA